MVSVELDRYGWQAELLTSGGVRPPKHAKKQQTCIMMVIIRKIIDIGAKIYGHSTVLRRFQEMEGGYIIPQIVQVFGRFCPMSSWPEPLYTGIMTPMSFTKYCEDNDLQRTYSGMSWQSKTINILSNWQVYFQKGKSHHELYMCRCSLELKALRISGKQPLHFIWLIANPHQHDGHV